MPPVINAPSYTTMVQSTASPFPLFNTSPNKFRSNDFDLVMKYLLFSNIMGNTGVSVDSTSSFVLRERDVAYTVGLLVYLLVYFSWIGSNSTVHAAFDVYVDSGRRHQTQSEAAQGCASLPVIRNRPSMASSVDSYGCMSVHAIATASFANRREPSTTFYPLPVPPILSVSFTLFLATALRVLKPS